ncbi:MAG: hypothetical protein U1F29_06615 [Planctomycetota bacterium]
MRRASVLAFVAFLAACSGGDGIDVRIGGHVLSDEGEPVSGAALRITWPDDPHLERIEYSDAHGAWSWGWGNPAVHDFDWRHVVVEPALDGYSFSPTSYDLVAHGSTTDLDFTATALAPVRAGTVWWTTTDAPRAWRAEPVLRRGARLILPR